MADRPPAVWIPSLGHGAGLLGWHRRPDGWWAHLVCVTSVDWGGSYVDSLIEWELWSHESLIQPRLGYDYSRVPRHT